MNSMSNEITYASSGVDVQLGDDASKVLYQAAKLTWENRKGCLGEIFTPFDDFTGLRVVNVGSLPQGTVMCLGFDGVGTKVEIAERLQKHDTVAYDLLAMVCDDAVVRGGEPVLVGSILDVKALSNDGTAYLDFVKQLARGYIGAAKAARVAIINGEVAELGVRVSGYGDFNYNWGAGCVWFANRDRLLTGKEILPGQYVVALRENGFRSNGLSLARKILQSKLGERWHECDKGREYASGILMPSIIYSAAVTDMVGGVQGEPRAVVTGIAHITGGGIPGKLGRVLKPSGFGAELDSLFDPPVIMQELKSLANIRDEEAYKTWNMGNGMLIITPEPQKVIDCAKNHNREAKIAGRIVEKVGITIKTNRGQILNFSTV